MGKGRAVAHVQAMRRSGRRRLGAGFLTGPMMAPLLLGLALMAGPSLICGPALADSAPQPPAPTAAATTEAATAPAGQKIIKAQGFSTFGEFKYQPGFDHLDYVNPDAPKGGEMSFFALGTFDSMNPYSRKGRAGALSNVMYESLLSATADEISAEYCLLCESLEYPESQDWVIFHLRRDVKFSDGTPLTAQDVAFSHNLLLEQGLPSYAEAVRALIPKAEALDDYTVKFTFADGVPRKGLIGQAGAVPVWSKAWFERTGARLDQSRMETSPGSGPYLFDSYDINRRIMYRRNPDYWGKDLPLMKGRANFDTIRVEYFADTTAAFEAFKSGDVTFRIEDNPSAWVTGYDFPAMQKGWVKKVALPTGNIPAAAGLVFNLRRAPFDDLKVRQALALMYNFSWTNDTLQHGLNKQRNSFWQGSALEAKGLPEGRELELLQTVKDGIDPAIFTEPATMAHESGKQQLDRRNQRQALALLAEAGWKPDATGQIYKDGKRLQLELLGSDPNMDRYLVPYVDNLKRLGVDARYTRVDPAQYTNRERDFDWDMIYDSYLTGLEEGIGLTQRFGSDGLGDVFNPAGYATPAVDKLAKAVVDATSYDEMAAAVRAIDRIMRRALFVVPTWYKPDNWVAYYDMFEHPETLPPYAVGYLDWWWVNADRAATLKAEGAIR